MAEQHPFKWRHFQSDIILLRVRWYLRSSLSSRDLEEMMQERGLHVDHTTISRWGQHSAPELEKRCRPSLKACNDSWRVDETSGKGKGVWMDLSQAVDSDGQTLEFLLRPTRDAQSAQAFFLKALASTARSVSQANTLEKQVPQTRALADPTTMSAPGVINVDKNAASPKAMADLQVAGILPASVELRQVTYLTTLIEQDHRFLKRLTKPGMGFFSFERAWRTRQGYEMMNRMRKGQVRGVSKADISKQITFIAHLF